ncbi:MAG: acyltransferase [Paludibacter sp.]|nr:acyltransferase [Paludibacter sp.]
MILKKDYSIYRVIRKFTFFFASKFPFLPGKFRALLFCWGGVKFTKPLSCFIGFNVYFDDLHPELIHIGENTIITEGTRVLSHFLDPSYNDFDHQFTATVIIGNNVFIGMNVVIVKPITVGDGAIIGANSVVIKDIPPYTIWGGNPVKYLKNREIINK